MARKLNIEKRAEICNLYRKGTPCIVIADMVQCTANTVYNVLEEHGLRKRRSGRSKYRKRPPSDIRDSVAYDDIVSSYAPGVTYIEIANKCHVSPAHVYRVLRVSKLIQPQPRRRKKVYGES